MTVIDIYFILSFICSIKNNLSVYQIITYIRFVYRKFQRNDVIYLYIYVIYEILNLCLATLLRNP